MELLGCERRYSAIYTADDVLWCSRAKDLNFNRRAHLYSNSGYTLMAISVTA